MFAYVHYICKKKGKRCWFLSLDSSLSFFHDFTITPLIIRNGPTLTYLSFRYCLQGHCKVALSSQLPIPAGWTAACVKVCFSRGLPNPWSSDHKDYALADCATDLTYLSNNFSVTSHLYKFT